VSIPTGCAGPAEALALFATLEPVAIDFMLGAWAGTGFPSDHPLDGALEAYGWRGKRFDSPEQVHPLVFRWAGRTLHAAPARLVPFLPLVMRLPWLKSPPAAALVRLLLPLFATRSSQARLRAMRHDGDTGAAMIYDRVPIQDVFRRVDDDTVLGMMDCKGMAQPFFFLLRRERA
jgi:hypothetical protein